MRTFELGMNLLVVTSVALLGASVATNPFNLVWQLLLIFYSVTNCAMALLATWLLVAVPIYIAKSADRVRSLESHSEMGDVSKGGLRTLAVVHSLGVERVQEGLCAKFSLVLQCRLHASKMCCWRTAGRLRSMQSRPCALDPCPCLARDTSDTQLACRLHFDHSIAQLATAEWWEEEDDMEHALGGGDGATGPPQEMALLDKRPGTLSDDVSSGSGSETGSHGGSSRGGGPGGSRKSLLQPSSLKSSSQASF